MKQLSVLFLVVLSICVGLTPSKGHAKRHYLFLVHGVGGSQSTFYSMDRVLSIELKRLQPDFDVTTKILTYATGDNTKNTLEFAAQVAQTIEESVRSYGGLQDDDKVSVIGHSQGGIVATIWLYQSMLGTAGFYRHHYDHLRNLITLGTPFWGAKAALTGKTLESIFGGWVVPFVGTKEFEGLAFGSKNIQAFRDSAIELLNSGKWSDVFGHVRPLFIAGQAKGIDPILRADSGRYVPETDGVVPFSSARFDFLYVKANSKMVQTGEIKTPSPFVIVPALHSGVTPSQVEVNFPWFKRLTKLDLSSVIGLPQVEDHCILSSQCRNPALQVIMNHLLEIPQITETPDSKNTTSFVVEVRVGFEGLLPNPQKLRIDFFPEDLGKNHKGERRMKIASKRELMSRGLLAQEVTPGHLTNYFLGTSIDTHPNETRHVMMEISAPGFKPLRFQIPVRPTFSTFVDAILTP
ncbi:MAG: hypothetical protein IT289_04295 [Oligoflexia bacterium]|nr:hypothetical protein [Oligoflexia bacterium]